jgi:transcriptional regulator with XRE-family HTH domain
MEPRWRELARSGVNRGRIVSSFLRSHMEQVGIETFAALAERMGLNAATISWWKTTDDRTRTKPKYSHMALLVEVLGCSADDAYEAFGLRETAPAPDAIARQLAAIMPQLSPSDQAFILELALSRLQRQPQNHNQRQLEHA